MNNAKAIASLGSVLGLALTGSAIADEILVTENITKSETWTSDHTYNLQNQIYVLEGASLTIEAGTVVASTPTDDGSGSLAVARGGQIFVQGTQDAPVIMTSTNDDFMNWREAANEWGNLTIMGRGFVSNTFVPDNEPFCDPDNVSPMEGLVPDFAGDPKTLYGGGDDDDDSGSISYLSIRYGGRVLGLANELNGLSLGGIGRATEIHHVEIMNNVDDGIEMWGGAPQLKYVSVWNVGDDSLDVDQGMRGKIQFGLIVQGYSLDADQGSGVGDNCFETDGAEDSDAQPVTTTTIYNCTVIGQPAPGAGDGGTTWRDNARIQYRNCTFMDLGEKLVRFDNLDGDGSQGYGYNGTLTWPQTWNTNAGVHSTVNECDDPDSIYMTQVDGKLAEIRGSVFFRNLDGEAYTEADARGVFAAGMDNILTPGFDAEDAPIADIQRGPAVTRGGKTMLPVIGLDPRPVNDALVEPALLAPDDGFFTPAPYRGAFDPDGNWLCLWTAADQYGYVIAPPGGCKLSCSPTAGDTDDNGVVDVTDLLNVLAEWGSSGAPGTVFGDTTCDGVVDVSDLLDVLANWS